MIKKLKLLLTGSLVLFAFQKFVLASSTLIGSPAPNFTLNDINGKEHAISDYKGRYVVLEWTNYDCPFVKKHYDTGNMQALQKKWTDKGVIWLSICSSAPGKEGNKSPEEWRKAVEEKKAAPTAVLLDEEGLVGKKYEAKTTPTMVIINPDGNVIYKGAIDNHPTYKHEGLKSAKNYVSAALDEAMNGKPVTISYTDSYGCSVKYKE